MKKFNTLLLLITLLLSSFSSMAQEKYEPLKISMFPKAEKGYKQVYIQVPIQKNEKDFSVEVFVGIETEVDCNVKSVSGSIKDVNLEGWGYTYYNVESNLQFISTMMACPDNSKTKRFVTMKSQIIRYNSKLPIVLYIPEEMTVKYRLWSAEENFKDAKIQ